ncbi:SDR family NAD(P)-dependent oxidoreductase [Photobacterium angustum]|uniref:Oxidoreductase, short-chain dehydrogenase/reductase family protein n=1 Tax=Photobacterium angustum (strain S14 / CCUG 15956) TaxID=314292 RepID=Q1ZTN1_PHOAS|nr:MULTISPECIES: SDR family oxidoreductase [Photobacterium]EAS66729.1 oxidoreductase, short-chain dehydrogenase/reductase family protein [Photobacterium angustum S14]PSV69686.1 SDR family NAD(P)-dependent oxidoreductase [Photobacterium angustum]PSV95082.1 SDR family NAD(P)-dependent oxidoreductase [Photobacterium angustum]PSW80149.1 SDR family NAD(P)-dependent oxidoreductase [Photobacterium angustum]PSW89964.1 SDR family NAD(P)-dependent oxidoreductase [Photobacterium angustum]
MQFLNKVAIVTGGSTGIGKSTVELLIDRGAIVYNIDINTPDSNNSHFIHCDITDYEKLQKVINNIYLKEKKIDALFANAGVHLVSNIEQTSLEELDKVISVNIKGVFYTLKTVIPLMKEQRQGNILLMGSDQSFVGKGLSAAYGLTKGAIAQLTKSTAIDYAEFNIKINCICPGTIDTPLLEKAKRSFMSATGLSGKEVMNMLEEAQPIKRIARPDEIAKLACYLLSDDNSFMTGSLVPIDGGYTCQ